MWDTVHVVVHDDTIDNEFGGDTDNECGDDTDNERGDSADNECVTDNDAVSSDTGSGGVWSGVAISGGSVGLYGAGGHADDRRRAYGTSSGGYFRV